MKVSEMIALLSLCPHDFEVEFVGFCVRAPGASRAPKTSAERMRELRVRQELLRVGNGAGPPPENVTGSVTQDSARDDTRDEVTLSVTNSVTGGIQGGSEIGSTDQIRKEAENQGRSGSSLSGQDREGAAGDELGDAPCDDMRDETAPADSSPKTSRVPSRASKRAPRKTAIPDDFKLEDEYRVYASTKGWPGWWAQNRFDAFVELSKAKGWVYADWKLALYGFWRREVDEFGRGPDRLTHLKPKEQVRQPYVEQARARAAEQQRRLEAEVKGPVQTTMGGLIAGIGGRDA